MTVQIDHNVQSASGTAFVGDATGGSGAPPPDFVHRDANETLRVCHRDASGGYFVAVHRAAPAPPVHVKASSAANSMVATTRADIALALRQLKAFERLDRGWDGDSAPAPTPVAIHRASEIVALASARHLPDEIDPDAVGGIALWFYADGGHMTMIGVRNDGRVAVCLYRANAPIPAVKIVSDAAAAVALAMNHLG